VAFPIITPYTILTGIQHPAVNIPLDVVTQIVRWLDSGCDLANVALVQRSWCYPAQVELFRAVILKCPLRAQLFVEAFVRNLGPGNPAIRRGVNCLPLERYVRYIYVDVPENYSQADFYNSLGSFLPLLTNLQSLYIVMRRWDVYIWDIQLGKHLPEHAPPSLQRLCIQVSGHMNTMIYYLSLQLRFPQVIQPPGRSRTGQTSIGGGHGLRSGNTFGQSPSSAKTYAGGDRLTQQHPRHARRRKKMYASGWLTLHWIVLRYGLAPVESSSLRSFEWPMLSSIISIKQSFLAIDTVSNVTKRQVSGCYRGQRSSHALPFLDSAKMSALSRDAGFAK